MVHGKDTFKIRQKPPQWTFYLSWPNFGALIQYYKEQSYFTYIVWTQNLHSYIVPDLPNLLNDPSDLLIHIWLQVRVNSCTCSHVILWPTAPTPAQFKNLSSLVVESVYLSRNSCYPKMPSEASELPRRTHQPQFRVLTSASNFASTGLKYFYQIPKRTACATTTLAALTLFLTAKYLHTFVHCPASLLLTTGVS